MQKQFWLYMSTSSRTAIACLSLTMISTRGHSWFETFEWKIAVNICEQKKRKIVCQFYGFDRIVYLALRLLLPHYLRFSRILLFRCQVNTDPMKMQTAYLEVVIPPDIVYEETSGDMMVPEGSSAKLVCKARGFPKPKITWRREDGREIIARNGPHGKTKGKLYSTKSKAFGTKAFMSRPFHSTGSWRRNALVDQNHPIGNGNLSVYRYVRDFITQLFGNYIEMFKYFRASLKIDFSLLLVQLLIRSLRRWANG